MKPTLTLSALLAVTIAGCTTPDSPEPTPLSGGYIATQFSTTVGGRTLDRIAEGLVLRLTLQEDGATTGQLMLGEDTVSFVGTWDSSLARVHLQHTRVDLLELLPLRTAPPLLIGDSTFGAVRFRVTLQRIAGI